MASLLAGRAHLHSVKSGGSSAMSISSRRLKVLWRLSLVMTSCQSVSWSTAMVTVVTAARSSRCSSSSTPANPYWYNIATLLQLAARHQSTTACTLNLVHRSAVRSAVKCHGCHLVDHGVFRKYLDGKFVRLDQTLSLKLNVLLSSEKNLAARLLGVEVGDIECAAEAGKMLADEVWPGSGGAAHHHPQPGRHVSAGGAGEAGRGVAPRLHLKPHRPHRRPAPVPCLLVSEVEQGQKSLVRLGGLDPDQQRLQGGAGPGQPRSARPGLEPSGGCESEAEQDRRSPHLLSDCRPLAGGQAGGRHTGEEHQAAPQAAPHSVKH